jgi:hypothetical protein
MARVGVTAVSHHSMDPVTWMPMPGRMLTLGFLLLAGRLALAAAYAQPGDDPPPPPPPPVLPDFEDELPKKEPRKPLPTTDEGILAEAKIKTDPASLLEFLRGRTLTESERPKVSGLVKKLGSGLFRDREQAMKQLIRRGPIVVDLLKASTQSTDPEISRRAEQCIERIMNSDVGVEAPAAAVRMLAKKKPPETVETLLAYLPFADNDQVSEEIRAALAKMAAPEGKALPLLVSALSDAEPTRRWAAAEALVKAGAKEPLPGIRKLLEDSDPTVRMRVSIALIRAHEKQAVPVLIDVATEVPANLTWEAEDILYKIAELASNPPLGSPKTDAASRKAWRDDWHSWWQKHEGKTELAKLENGRKLLGNTLIVLLDLGQALEVGPDNKTRWSVSNLVFPLDVQLIGEDRLLVAEYHAGKVTERSIKTGEIVWEKQINGALMAQRLPNGHTFLATDTQLIEYDAKDKEVLNVGLPNGERIMKAMKLANGDMACLTSEARVVRLDSKGREINSFSVNLGARLFGGRLHMELNGRVLVPHNNENRIIEYDSRGRKVWEADIEQPVAASRLPDGHVIVTTMLPQIGAVEFNRQGERVWSYKTQAQTRVTRAYRR